MAVKAHNLTNITMTKKSSKLLLALGFALSTGVTQAQIDNLVNLSPDWVRTGARNTASDAPDAAVYNPAGMSQLTPGLHIAIGNQSLFRNPEHFYNLGMGDGPQSASQSGADWLLPNIYASFNRANTAFYAGYYLSGGGATANYPGGSINTDLISLQALMGAQGAYGTTSNQFFKASSAYHTLMGGMSYGLSDKFSVGITAKYIMAKNTADAGITLTASPFDLPDAPLALSTEESATGGGVTLSMMVAPTENFKASVRYETKVALDFENKTITDDFGITTDGAETPRDLPACFAAGIEYKFNPRFKVMADYNYYFQTQADWGKGYVLGEEKEFSKMAGNAAMYGFAMEYAISVKMRGSLGGTYSTYEYADKDGYFTKPGAFETLIDDNFSVNTGITYSVSKVVDFTFGYMINIFRKDTVKALNAYPLEVEVDTQNSMSTVALGLNISF